MVGYQANTLPTGYTMITPCFEAVDGDTYAIDNFILKDVADTTASVQVVNPDGTWGTRGVWLNEFVDGDTVYPAGWFTDASGETAADINLTPGQAVFFYTTATAGSAQSAGQVSGTITKEVATGYSMIGNASPVTISIDEITCVDIADTTASVQVVNPDGTWGTRGVWLNEFVDGDTIYPAGWFTDASGETAADITLTPGQSVFFYTTATNGKVVIPSALAD